MGSVPSIAQLAAAQRFCESIDASRKEQAADAVRKVLSAAKSSYLESFPVDLGYLNRLGEVAQNLVLSTLMAEHGFTEDGVRFMNGSTVVVAKNPFCQINLQARADEEVQIILKLIADEPTRPTNRLSIGWHVPPELRELVAERLTRPELGWYKVEFVLDRSNWLIKLYCHCP